MRVQCAFKEKYKQKLENILKQDTNKPLATPPTSATAAKTTVSIADATKSTAATRTTHTTAEITDTAASDSISYTKPPTSNYITKLRLHEPSLVTLEI